MLLKLGAIIIVAAVVSFLIARSLPALRRGWQRLARNPLLKTLLISGLWRLIRLLIFRRF